MNPAQKILIVDDTPENLQVLGGILEAENVEVCIALDGQQALALVEDFIPDLILLDVMMPGLNGYQVCERLKADPRTRDIPVIFLTALNDEENEAQALALGACDFITKPFKMGLVKMRIRNQLAIRNLQTQLAGYANGLEIKVRERTQELEESRERLRLLHASKDLVLKMIAQELTIQATGITGIAHIALSNLPDNSKRQRWQQVFSDHVARLNKMIDNAALLGKLDTPEAILELKPLNLRSEVDQALAQVRDPIITKQIQVDFPPSDVVYTQSDPSLLVQTLTTILKMALTLANPDSRLGLALTSQGKTVAVRIDLEGLFDFKQARSTSQDFSPKILETLTTETSAIEITLAEKTLMVFGGESTWSSPSPGKIVCEVSLRAATF